MEGEKEGEGEGGKEGTWHLQKGSKRRSMPWCPVLCEFQPLISPHLGAVQVSSEREAGAKNTRVV